MKKTYAISIVYFLAALSFFTACSVPQKNIKSEKKKNAYPYYLTNSTPIQKQIFDNQIKISNYIDAKNYGDIQIPAEKIIQIDYDNFFAAEALLLYGKNSDKIIDNSQKLILSDTFPLFEHYRDYINCAVKHSSNDNFSESVRLLQTALFLKPYRRDINHALSSELYKRAMKNLKEKNDNSAIIRDILDARLYNPLNPDISKKIMNIYFNANMLDAYISSAEIFLLANSVENIYQPENFLYHFTSGDSYLLLQYIETLHKLGKQDKILEIFYRTPDLETDDHFFYYYSNSLKTSGEYEIWKLIYKHKLLFNSPDNTGYIEMLKKYFTELDENENSEKTWALEKLVDLYSKKNSTYKSAADITEKLFALYYASGDYRKFFELFCKWPENKPSDDIMIDVLNKDIPLDILNKVYDIIIKRNIALTPMFYIKLLDKLGKNKTILSTFSNEIKSHKNPEILKIFIKAALAENNYNEALPPVKKLSLFAGENQDALYYLGLIYEKSGNFNLASESLKKIKKNNEFTKDAEFHLLEIEWKNKKNIKIIDDLEKLYTQEKSRLDIKKSLLDKYLELSNPNELKNDTQISLFYLNKAYSLFNDDTRVIKMYADYYYKKKDFFKAADFYNKFLYGKPHDIDIMLRLADVYKTLEKFDELKIILTEALATDYHNPLIKKKIAENGYEDFFSESDSEILRAYNCLKELSFNPDLISLTTNRDELLKTSQKYEFIFKFKKHFSQPLLLAGLIQMRLNNQPKALEIFQNYNELFKTEEGMYYLGELMLKMKKNVEALNLFSSLKQTYPESELAFKGLISAYLNNYMINELTLLLQSTDIKNFSSRNRRYLSEIFFKIADFYFQTRNYGFALKYIDDAISCGEKRQDFTLFKIETARNLNDNELLKKLSLDFTVSDLNSLIRIILIKTEILIEENNFTEAEKYFNIMLTRNMLLTQDNSFLSTSAKKAYEHYLLYRNFRNNVFTSIITSKTHSVYSDYLRVAAFYYSGDISGANRQINSMNTADFPPSSHFHFFRAAVLNANSNWAASCSLIEKNLDYFDNNLKNKAVLLLMNNYISLKKFELALSISENFEFKPEFAQENLKLRALANFRSGKFKSAAKNYERYLIKSEDPDILFNCAACYAETGEFEKSIDICIMLLKFNYLHRDRIFAMLAIIYYKLNDRAQCYKYIELSLKLNPEQPVLINLKKDFNK